MYLYNITFVMAREQGHRFIDWISTHAVPALFGEGSAAVSYRMQEVVESGGEKPGPEHGLSMALQAEFNSEEDAHDWNDRLLPAVLGEYHRQFGPHVAFFTTLMKVVLPR